MARPHDLNEVIRELYDAATDLDKWPVFLDSLAEHFDSVGSQLLHVDSEHQQMSFSVLRGFDDFIREHYQLADKVPKDRALHNYQKHFSELMHTDPRIAVMQKYPGRPFSCRDMIDEKEFHESPMYKEINLPSNCEYTLAVNIPETNGDMIGLAVFRPREAVEYTRPEVDEFGALIPHLKQAISLQKKFAFLDFGQRAALEALDQISMGIVLVDRRAEIKHANQLAREVISDRDGLRDFDGYLAAAVPADQTRLLASIRDAVKGALDGSIRSGEAMTITRPSGEAAYQLVVSTLWGNHLRFRIGRLDEPLALVFVTVPGRAHETPAELLQRLFGLSPTEARILKRLVDGDTLKIIAAKFGISQHTVRQHMKVIFGKTDTHRQAELVKLVLSTPIWMSTRHSVP